MRLSRNEALLLGAVALVVFLCGLIPVGLLLLGLFGMGGFGMMGSWMPGAGMMGGMGIFWLILLGVPLLVLVGLVWWVASRGRTLPTETARRCPNCSRSVQPEWQVCPYCRADLREEDNL